MNEKRIREITEAFAEKRVAVVGDLFLDRYAVAHYSGVSRETGKPVIRIRDHYYVPGGTSNVAANLASPGGRVRCFGVLGNDPYATILKGLLTSFGASTAKYITPRVIRKAAAITATADACPRLDLRKASS